jgi:hypothetical protein
MADDLRDRVLAAVRKGLAAASHISQAENRCERCEAIDPATEKGVREKVTPHTTFTKRINSLTPSRPVPANRASQPGKEPAEPTAAYRATSTGPDDVGCKLEIVELPQAQRYRKTFGVLQLKPPALVPVERWRQCVQDGKRFLAKWGEQAEALGWTSADLFGLHTPPAKPHPSYSRLSRYGATGLCWLLQGREVIALTADSASIRNPRTGNVTVYRKHNKPALGDSLDDLDLGWRQ